MSGTPLVPLGLALALAVPQACGGSPTDPSRLPCATVDGIEICADRSEYAPGATISLTITNRRSQTVFKDACSTEVVGKTSPSAAFEVDYDPTLFCGEDVTLAEIAALMIEMAPGASIVESYSLARFAFQGFYRLNVWMLDETGERISTTPFHSGTFEVFPTAD